MTTPALLRAADILYPPEATGPLAELEADWDAWLRTMFPEHVATDFADHHVEFWEWVWQISLGVKPEDAFIAVWARGGAKSTSAELAVAALGARRARSYVLYVCDTQAQADEHVGNIAAMLEAETVARYYPSLGARKVNQYGFSRGWKRDRLVTASGLVVDALGLDTGARGVKFDENRPDLIVFDDLDGEDDHAATTSKKIDRITKKLLPAGAPSLAVLGIQNLIIPDGVFAQLADGRADFLAKRRVSGPIPAVVGLVTEENPDAGQDESRNVIIAGEPTWAGQDLTVCQSQIDTWGLTAFLVEAQHEVSAPPGGMYDRVSFTRRSWSELPDLIRSVTWVDPAVTDTDQSDSHAYCTDALGVDGAVYRLESWEGRTSPEDSIRRAILSALRHGCQSFGVETDQGGDTWRSVVDQAWQRLVAERTEVQFPDEVRRVLDRDRPMFKQDKAGSLKKEGRGIGQPSKAARGARMLADYERPGRIVHVIGHPLVPDDCTPANLERALRRFPRTKPFDLADAAFWSWKDLRGATAKVSTGTRQLRAAMPSTKGQAMIRRR